MASSDAETIAIRPPPSATHSRLVAILLVIACLAFVVAGFVVYGVCNGGASLMLFGVATACLGAVLFRTGAWATVIPFAILSFILIAGGAYGATIAGCSL
jgi:dienelactone hydrolase